MNRSARNRQEAALGERGRRVLEDGSTEERRCHPDGNECRNLLKDGRRLWGDKDGRRISLLVLAGRDQRDGALMIGRGRVRVEAGMQLR